MISRDDAGLTELREDLKNLNETVAKLLSNARDDAARSVREKAANLTDRVSSMAGDLAEKSSNAASAATDQAKTFVGEVESLAHRKPFGALAGALLVGILIGMLGRRN